MLHLINRPFHFINQTFLVSKHLLRISQHLLGNWRFYHAFRSPETSTFRYIALQMEGGVTDFHISALAASFRADPGCLNLHFPAFRRRSGRLFRRR
jgi:hypothetical protein